MSTVTIELPTEIDEKLRQQASELNVDAVAYLRAVFRGVLQGLSIAEHIRANPETVSLPPGDHGRTSVARTIPDVAIRPAEEHPALQGTSPGTRPMTGAEALAYWEKEDALGVFSDAPDSPEFARELRRRAEARE